MTLFAVGERALVVCRPEECCPDSARYIGKEVTVSEPLSAFPFGFFYPVTTDDGLHFLAAPRVLRKPPKPRWTDTPQFQQLIKTPIREPELA